MITKYLKKTLITCAFLFCALISTTILPAQISIGGKPYSFSQGLSPKNMPVVKMPEINLQKIQEEDESDKMTGQPPRFGYPIEVNLNLTNSGVWETLPTGDRLWRLSIEAPGAKSINLLYNDFYLPQGSVFFIYSADKTHVIGGFTSANNKADRVFASGLVYSDHIVLEYYEPAATTKKAADQKPAINIQYVVHGYRYIQVHKDDLEKAFDDSGNCNVNTICAEGNNWRDQIRSVALMLVGGTRWCTGYLVNNTAQDCRALFLTANHCLSTFDAVNNPNANTFSFIWRYESPNCTPDTDGPTNLTTSGATVLANPGNPGDIFSSDFALLELTESPRAAGYDVHFAGFDATTTPPAAATGIHHPSGDVKKISMENDALTGTSYSSGSGTATHWRITDWDSGTTEPGSSGSPVFSNATGRAIGFLSGGGAACGNNESDWYGQIGYSWNNAGATDSRRRLRDHLDPVGLGATTALNGTDGTCCDVAIVGVAKTNEICPGASDGSITVTATTTNGPLGFSISGPVNQSNGTGIFTGLPPGNYNIVVTDSGVASCVANASINIAPGADNTPPVLFCPTDLTVSCDSINQLAATGEATATDNCDPSPVVTYADEVLSGDCEWQCTVARTWKAVDVYGNESTCVQKIISSSLPLLQAALSKDIDGDGVVDPLVVGRSHGKVTLDAADAACIISWMPSKGDSAMALITEQVEVEGDCLPGTNPIDVDGTLMNPLFAEGLELSLKVRLNPGFGDTLLAETGCPIKPIVLQFLPPNPTVSDLLRLSDIALGNLIGPPHLEALLDAIRCVNEGYDICDKVNESPRPGKKLQRAVSQLQLPDFRLFPNPTSGDVTVDLSQYPNQAVRLEVYDVQGRLLQVQEIHTAEMIMVRPGLAAYEDGIYLIRVQVPGLKAIAKRVILHRN
ncbi:MAG: trypsin-like peptidase domain-containing protein [Saprospiraceae bacterium]|nr:trypsin-like peptidase domain-containing protein [Saprospiraceae bacterium]